MKHPALSSRENLKKPQNSKGDRDENKGHNSGKGGMRDRRNGPFHSRVDPDRAGTDVSTDNRNFCRFPCAGSCILFLQARPVGAGSREKQNELAVSVQIEFLEPLTAQTTGVYGC